MTIGGDPVPDQKAEQTQLKHQSSEIKTISQLFSPNNNSAKRNRNSCKRKTVILLIYKRPKMVYTEEKGGEKHDSN
jgi:hypothetical protein